jgi:hypothetical protein
MRARLAILAAAVAAVVAAEAYGRATVPARADWMASLHPLVGAAPPGSFPFQPAADPWLDLRGRAFASRRGGPRVLLVGGASALSAVPAIEPRLAGIELVVAARESYGAAHEAVMVARFASPTGASLVAAIDGEELLAPDRPDGWTPEWDWHDAAVSSPIGERLARSSGLARLVFLPRAPAPAPFARARRRYLQAVRATDAAARSQGLAVVRIFAPGPGLPAEDAAALRADLARDDGPERRLVDSTEALVREVLARR